MSYIDIPNRASDAGPEIDDDIERDSYDMIYHAQETLEDIMSTYRSSSKAAKRVELQRAIDELQKAMEVL